MYTARGLRSIFIITVILLSYSMLSAQVKIKERVEIKPILPEILNETNSTPAAIHIEFTAGTDVTIRLVGPQLSVYGHNTVTADICYFDANYYYQVSCLEIAHSVEVPYRITATVGSFVLFDYQGVWDLGPSTYGYCGDDVWIDDPFGRFDVMTGWNVCEGEWTSIDIDINALPECSNDNYYLVKYDPITLTIIQGQELGKLFLNDKTADGNSLTLTYSEYIYPNKIGFRVNETLPEGFTGGTVVIQASARSIEKSASIDVFSCIPQCILAIAEKSPLSVGDTTSLSFIYTDTGNPVAADKKIDISVLGGSDGEDGYLLAGGSTDISFGGVTQPIRYIAPLTIAGDSLVVPIRAFLTVAGGGIPMKIQKDDSVKTTPVKINKMMSRTMSECEIGSVTVEKRCANIKYDINGNPVEYVGILDIIDPRVSFTINKEPIENPSGCSYIDPNTGTQDPTQVGATGPLIIKAPGIKGGEYSNGKGGSGSYYLDNLEFEIPWGICIDKIKSLCVNNIILVDETHNYPTNIADAQAMINDFNKFQINGIRGNLNSLKYYPLSSTIEHEKSHVGEWKLKISEVYCWVINEIFNLPLPLSNWCIQDEENITKWLDFKKDNYQNILSLLELASVACESELSDLNKNETKQYNAGYQGIQNLIAKISSDIQRGIIK